MGDHLENQSNVVFPVKTEPQVAVGLFGEAWCNDVLGEFNFKFHGEWLYFLIVFGCRYATITRCAHNIGVSMRDAHISCNRSWAGSGAY